MARIPDDTVNRIKQDIDLLRLVQSQGYEVARQGKDSVVRCPFHEEATPSCIISPKTNLFHCFGCCSASHSHRSFSQTNARRIWPFFERFPTLTS